MIHSELFQNIVEWAKQPSPRKPTSLFLYGPPGIGKTTLAHAALEAAGYRVVEWNASQHRHKAAVEDSLVPLLNSRNVADFFRPEGPRNLGLVLDEIDGMSVGDKGGLMELLRILKEYNGDNAIICISNEWMEKKFQPFQKICQAFQVSKPSETDVMKLIQTQFDEIGAKPPKTVLDHLTKDLLTIHSGDIRKILQSIREIRADVVAGILSVQTVRKTIETGLTDAHALGTNRIHRSETIKTAVGQLLRGDLDIMAEVPLNNNDLNLAGLHLHESLPTWIKTYYGNTPTGYERYMRSFENIVASDRLDYYTFFFQHWTLFSLTYQAKLQAVNQELFRDIKGNAKEWKDNDMEYTAVLSKQSMLYNQFRYLCEMRDLFVSSSIPHDQGFDSTYWQANLYLIAAKEALKQPTTPGYGKKLGGKVWENTEFWRNQLPTWFPGAVPQRFMRLLQALDIPIVEPMPCGIGSSGSSSSSGSGSGSGSGSSSGSSSNNGKN
jgi:DNA polymerase III delta prime subunit